MVECLYSQDGIEEAIAENKILASRTDKTQGETC